MGQLGSAFRGKNRGTQSVSDARSIISKLVVAHLIATCRQFTEQETLIHPSYRS